MSGGGRQSGSWKLGNKKGEGRPAYYVHASVRKKERSITKRQTAASVLQDQELSKNGRREKRHNSVEGAGDRLSGLEARRPEEGDMQGPKRKNWVAWKPIAADIEKGANLRIPQKFEG